MKTIIKNREQIAKIVNQKLTENNPKKTDIVKNLGISRNTLYKIMQKGGRTETYSIDSFFKICKELGIEIKVEY